MRLCVCPVTLSPFATIGEPFLNRESSNSYPLAVKRLSLHHFCFFSPWELPFNRFNKRLTVFSKYKNCSKLFFSFSSYPLTVSSIVVQPKVSLSSNPHFSCFPCQIKPSKSFLITFRTFLSIQNFKSSPKFKNPKSKP